MGFKKKVKEFFSGFDLFSQPITLRYHDETGYSTFTGGLCSILMIVAFIAIFTGTAMNTINKVHVDSQMTQFQEADPSYYTVGMNNFMFAIGINGINLNSGDRWFDIYLQYRSYHGNQRNKTYISMIPCEKNQWSSINQQFGVIYDRLGFDEWLCPPDNLEMELQGKYTSEYFKFYKISVTECDPTLDLTRACVNSSVITSYLNSQESFSFNFYFVNKIINGESHEYISNYLEDMNYFPFSTTSGVNANIYMATYTIITDESIYPFEEKKNDTGGIVTEKAQIHNYGVQQNQYLKVYLRKSSQDILVQRSFRKADDTLSYIGGLFSAILALLMLLSSFNQLSYELDIASSLYHYKKNEPIDPDEFNFFVYLGFTIYEFLRKLCINLPSQSMAKYHHCLEQARKQMDIGLIMKKIVYSQKLSQVLLQTSQRKLLYLHQSMTIEEVEAIRKDHQFYQQLQRYYFSENFSQNITNDSNVQFIANKKSKNEVFPSDARSHNSTQQIEKNIVKEGKFSEELSQFEEYKQMISDMKVFLKRLEWEAKSGNQISKRILEKVDPQLKKQLGQKPISKQKKFDITINQYI